MREANIRQSVSADRRIDLDWIRIAAFGLLIFYHVGMVFVPWYYHVKSTHLMSGLEPFMLALNPWRLSLLFLVAGAATRFMAAKTAPGALIRIRSARLLVPLVFGMLVIVPPQSYWEVVSRHLYSDSFFSFYVGQYFSFSAQFCTGTRCIILPTWNHLWFVAYLWVYTAIAMLVVALLARGVERIEATFERWLTGVWLIVLPATTLAIYRLLLFPEFPPSNALVGDWYNHALYFSMFAMGFLIARSEIIWTAISRWRWLVLFIAAASFGGFIVTNFNPTAVSSSALVSGSVQRTAYGVYQWSIMLAVLGFGRLWLTRDSAIRRYLTDAIFPYYIIHQTVILGVAFALRSANLPAAAEAAIIVAVTAASCVLTYEIVRRLSWLRPLFGLKPQPAVA